MTRLEYWERRLCNEYAELHAGLVRQGLEPEAADRVCEEYVRRRIAAIPRRETRECRPRTSTR